MVVLIVGIIAFDHIDDMKQEYKSYRVGDDSPFTSGIGSLGIHKDPLLLYNQLPLPITLGKGLYYKQFKSYRICNFSLTSSYLTPIINLNQTKPLSLDNNDKKNQGMWLFIAHKSGSPTFTAQAVGSSTLIT